MMINRSSRKQGVVGLVGHAGVGHVHSHAGFVQDDSAGFAVAVDILRRAYPVDLTLTFIQGDVDTGMIRVRTADGGCGEAVTRRGVTPVEHELMQRIVGREAVCTQTLAFDALGRIYGQGVLETPVALQAAIALACVDTFRRKWPQAVHLAVEDVPGQIGTMLGAVVEVGQVPVSVMALVNASQGGVGPVEDLEGNVCLGAKGRLMQALGLDGLPTVIVESKAYVPAVCSSLEDDAFWFRINRDWDNVAVYESLCRAAEELGLAFVCSDSAYPRVQGGMERATRDVAEKIVGLGTRLGEAATSRQKVALVAELALVISQDCGGVTFMSNDLNGVVSGGGTVPGTSAVISMLVSPDNIAHWKIPVLTQGDLDRYRAVVCRGVALLAGNVEAALLELKDKHSFEPERFAPLLGQG
ncbi:hypothetical protein [Desulfoluna sp.]|uniref:hypothetical protein n=1 Tax=Desulfoluna sp. TaxID=2045199 RepID=UPI0026189B21|nr:hypothetical protein [Desulfoluna sp.]